MHRARTVITGTTSKVLFSPKKVRPGGLLRPRHETLVGAPVNRLYGFAACWALNLVDFVQGVLQTQEYAFVRHLGAPTFLLSGHSLRAGKVAFHCLKIVYDERLGYSERIFLVKLSSSLQPSIWVRL